MRDRPVDSYRFVDPVSKRIMKAWAGRERVEHIPWTPLTKPLSECSVALLSTAGIALKKDQPFDQQGERDNPWWGDPSHRRIGAGSQSHEVNLYHLHIDTRPAQKDINCVLPLTRLAELAQEGLIGQVAATHYSIMGYILDEAELLCDTAPQIIQQLQQEKVDVLLLVPV